MALTTEDLQAISALIQPLIQPLNDSIFLMQKDLTEVKDDVSVMKNDIFSLKTDVAGLKSEMIELKNRIGCLEDRMLILEKRMDKMECVLHKINLHLETETDPGVQLIAESHIDLTRKLNEAIPAADKNLAYEVKVNYLIGEVRELREDVEMLKKKNKPA